MEKVPPLNLTGDNQNTKSHAPLSEKTQATEKTTVKTQSVGNLPQQINPIAKKLTKILESKLETDQDMLSALETTSDFFGANTLQNRRNLRRDIESRSLETNLQFLESFRRVKEKLDSVSSNVNAMDDCCKAMTERLKSTKEQTRELINRTTSLQAESKRLDKRAEVVNAFLKAFQLTPAESKALKGTADGAITPDFFPALSRVREIHDDCKHLLRTGQHTAGLEIMERMAAHQEAAYELLYRWIQRECRLLNADFVELNPLLSQAFEAMQERQVLFKYSLDEFSTARRNNMVKSFIDALTRGGPGGVPKPIELLSHDPLRYVGDMLAWIHQNLASEKEFLQQLLKFCKEELLKEQMPGILTHITDGICRPFKVRVEQVLSGENGPVVLYKLSNVFTFYVDTMGPSLKEGASLLHAVGELKELTQNLFNSSLTSNLQRLLDKIETPGTDLLPVQGLHQILLLLRDVLESHDTTLVPVVDKKGNFAKIFQMVLDPLQQNLILSGTHLSPVDVAVYMLNCLSTIHSLLALYEYTDDRLEMIQAQGPLSGWNGMDHHTLQTVFGKFDLFLSSPDSYRLPQITLLTSTKIKDSVQKRTMTAVCEAYKLIEGKVKDPMNNYESPNTIAPKSAEQVKQLLLG